MKIEILSRYTKAILFAGDHPNMRAALEAAAKSRANLSRANLYGANLYGANLSRANLSGADLSGANLYGADLSRADLSGANLYGADLSRADLSGANLSGANLYGANLSGANLYGANLYGANNAALTIARTRILPQGTLVGWKKARKGVIIELEIPKEAKRSHAFGRKCRCEFAKVVAIYGGDGETATSEHDNSFFYKLGEIAKPDSFSDQWQEECANGIHFYITREEAEAH